MGEERRDFGEAIEPVLKILEKLAEDKVYGPLDMLNRVEDDDEFYMRMARDALYTAMRYVSTEKGFQADKDLQSSVDIVLAMIEKKPHFAKELALKALARALAKRGAEAAQSKSAQGS